MSGFNLEGIRFDATPPPDLTRGELGATATLLTLAYEDGIAKHFGPDRRGEARSLAVDLTRADDLDAYCDSRVDPANDPLYAGQNFANIHLVRAFDGDTLVGYVWSADNTSGSPFMRAAKMYAPHFMPKVGGKRYAYQRELVVRPDHQERGIGHVLGALSLEQFRSGQIATAYTWPDLMPRNDWALEAVGFQQDGERQTHVGIGNRVSTLRRWKAPVEHVLSKIYALSGAPDAIAQAHVQIRQ